VTTGIAAITCWSLTLVAILSAGMAKSEPLSTEQVNMILPDDADKTAAVDPGDFANWFESVPPAKGVVTLNGLVKPANSLNFPDSTTDNVPFYRWAEQMFLWLTSPKKVGEWEGIVLTAPAEMGRTSPEFYMVSEESTLVPNYIPDQNKPPPNVALRVKKHRPHGLPAIDDKTQPDSDWVLVAQTKSLVYYMISVNDGYAFFLTGVKTRQFTPTPTRFPTIPTEFDPVIQLARHNHKPLAHPEALCVEVKTSWVEANHLSHPDSYIQMKATAPIFNQVNNKLWTLQERRGVINLALVGMHIAGSVNGHAEMIFATFEHLLNTPNDTYTYKCRDRSGNVRPKTVLQETTGESKWLFCQNGAKEPFNQPGQFRFPGPPVVIKPYSRDGSMSSIGPTNVIRYKPFGAASDTSPNPVVDAADSNTQIISMNNSVRSQLKPGDRRANYFMLGATWTDGKAPGVSHGGSPGHLDGPANVVGASQLANSTMETFLVTSEFNKKQNCFACHRCSAPDGKITTDVSRVFDSLQPLQP
jgi:hypothetical protein